MALDDDIRILSGVRLFDGFTAEQLRLLAFGAEQIGLPAGRRLFREDDEADTAYVVVSGTISLFREEDEDRLAVATAEPGMMIGELALIADTRRLTSAEAVEDTELLRLTRKMFRRILEEYPDVAVVLYQRIHKDFLAFVERIEALAPRFDG
jgi:CRP-like cAMP-binding protein